MNLDIPENFFRQIYEHDMIGKLNSNPAKPGLDDIYYCDPETGKWKLRNRSKQTETPWIHVKQDLSKDCKLYHFIFDQLKFIPRRCLNCWKVVVKPRTIKELVALYHVQMRLNRFSKCGIETRDYTRGVLYGGYFYNDGFEEGKKCEIEVRQAVRNYIDPDVPVILKRYCTEFEIVLKDSAKYKRPPHADWQEDWIYKNLENFEGRGSQQPEDIKIHVLSYWLKVAWKADPTDEIFAFGKPEDFYTTPRTY